MICASFASVRRRLLATEGEVPPWWEELRAEVETGGL